MALTQTWKKQTIYKSTLYTLFKISVVKKQGGRLDFKTEKFPTARVKIVQIFRPLEFAGRGIFFKSFEFLRIV